MYIIVYITYSRYPLIANEWLQANRVDLVAEISCQPMSASNADMASKALLLSASVTVVAEGE